MSKLLAQGGFGCIFYPGFNCDGKKFDKSLKLVTKLQHNDFTGRNESYIGSLITTIPNYGLYFLPVIKSCSIGLATLNKEIIDQCNIISKNDPKYLLMELPYLENISFRKLFADSLRSRKHILLSTATGRNHR